MRNYELAFPYSCVRVRLFTSIMHYKEHPYNHSGVSVNGPRAGDPPYSFCEADFPKSPDGGLDLKYVKMWWGIKDCQVRLRGARALDALLISLPKR